MIFFYLFNKHLGIKIRVLVECRERSNTDIEIPEKIRQLTNDTAMIIIRCCYCFFCFYYYYLLYYCCCFYYCCVTNK